MHEGVAYRHGRRGSLAIAGQSVGQMHHQQRAAVVAIDHSFELAVLAVEAPHEAHLNDWILKAHLGLDHPQ